MVNDCATPPKNFFQNMRKERARALTERIMNAIAVYGDADDPTYRLDKAIYREVLRGLKGL